jgi:hypothetical protein
MSRRESESHRASETPGDRIASGPKDDELSEDKLEKEYLESVRKESARGRTMTSVGGGLLLAAGATLFSPIVAIPAAIVGMGAGYKLYKDRERSSVDKAEKMLLTGDHAASNLPGEEGSSRPPLRRLIFLVRWASMQVANDLDNGDLKSSRLERVYDETVMSFSAWVQRIYFMRAEKSVVRREQELRLLKLHLSPLVRWLSSSPSNEVFMMVNHEFDKESTKLIKAGKREQEARIIRRCRSVFPVIIEVFQLFKLDDESKYAQIVHWITEFLRRQDISSFLAEAVLLHNHTPKSATPRPVLGSSDEDDHVEFPPLGVEQELEDDEFFSASEGGDESSDEDHPARNVSAHIARQITKSATSSPDRISSISVDNAHGVPDSVMFQQSKDSENPDRNSWTQLDVTELNVRGPNYLQDKIKIPSAPAMFEMLCFDLFYTDFPIPCVSTNKECKVYWLLQEDPDLFTFTINWRLHPMQAAVTYGVRKSKCDWIQSDCPERILLERFLEGNQEMRSNTVKVIPKVTEGPWLVRKAVGQTPAILGRKLKCAYHEEAGRFFEAEYDVLSTTAAKSMIGLIVGAAKRLVIDVAIVLEAKEADELPERILGGFRIHFPDLATCRRITLGGPVASPKKKGDFVSVNTDDSDVGR